MPVIHVITNIAAEKFADGAKAKEIKEEIEEKFGVPGDKLKIVVQPDAKIFMRGSAEPAVFLTIWGDKAMFSEEKAKMAFELITKKINADLGVEEKRIVITLQMSNPNLSAVGGVRVADLAA